MDLSKLPKLSQTPPPADNAAGPAPTAGSAAPKVELFCRCGAAIMPGTNFCSHCGANYYEAVGGRGGERSLSGGGAMWIEAFLSIAVGLFLILIAPNGIKYLSATLSGRAYTPYAHPTDPNQHVDYLRYQDPATGVITDYTYRDMFDAYWSDMAVTTFALALVLEGIVLALVRSRWIVLLSALLIAVVTVFNLWYVIASYTRINPITRQTYGLAPTSAIAVIFGVVMTGYQLMLFKELSGSRLRK
jgi:hypothetical protein